MVTSDAENHSPGIGNKGPFFIMNPLSNRCCQHNHGQGWPYYAENLWMASPDNGLAAVLYAASTVKAKAGDGTMVTIEEKTHYPFSGRVSFTVHVPHRVRFPLYLRVPGWCRNAAVAVNGRPARVTGAPDTYIRLEQSWKDGDSIVLDMPMHVSVVRWAANRNSASVNYGPLTFSLKIKERFEKRDPEKTALGDSRWQRDVDTARWPAYAIYPESPWNYGLLLHTHDVSSGFKVVRRPWPSDNFPFTPENTPLELVTQGKRIPSWQLDDNGLCGAVPRSPVQAGTGADKITLVPMGATRLRISAFPVVE
jgi:hypothetical protein